MGLGIYEAGTGMTRRTAGRGGDSPALRRGLVRSRVQQGAGDACTTAKPSRRLSLARLPIWMPKTDTEASRVSTPDSCQTHR